MIRFIGEGTSVYEGSRRWLPVKDGIAAQNFYIQPFVALDEDDKLMVGVRITNENRQLITTWEFYYRSADIFSAFRTLALLDLMVEVSRSAMEQAIRSTFKGKAISLDDREAIYKHVGTREHEKIMARTPPQIMEALNFLCRNLVKLDVEALTDEVRDGLLEYTDELEAMGVEHPDDVDARQRQQDDHYALFQPHVLACLAHMGIDTQHEDSCRVIVLEGLRRDIKSTALLVGYSVAHHVGDSNHPLVKLLFPADLGPVLDTAAERFLTKLAEFLITRFEDTRSTEDFITALKTLKRRWARMPRTVEL